MEVRELELAGVLEVIPKIFFDERGHFFESYNQEAFQNAGIDTVFIQDNQSFSEAGVVRGLHLQMPPFAQAKLVRVISGRVLDVIVDCRISSVTYGRTLCLELSSEKNNLMYIPEGFAHGFSAIVNSVFQYKCSNIYNKESEMGINPFDTELKIDWKVSDQIISGKDLELSSFTDFASPFL